MVQRYALRDDQWDRIKDLLPGRPETVGVAGVCLYLPTSIIEIRNMRNIMQAIRSSETDIINDVSRGTQ